MMNLEELARRREQTFLGHRKLLECGGYDAAFLRGGYDTAPNLHLLARIPHHESQILASPFQGLNVGCELTQGVASLALG